MPRFHLESDRSERRSPGPGWDILTHGRHDAVRDRIAARFLKMPDFTCGFCGSAIPFPTADIRRVEVEYTYSSKPRLRADVAALGGEYEVVASYPDLQTER